MYSCCISDIKSYSPHTTPMQSHHQPMSQIIEYRRSPRIAALSKQIPGTAVPPREEQGPHSYPQIPIPYRLTAPPRTPEPIPMDAGEHCQSGHSNPSSLDFAYNMPIPRTIHRPQEYSTCRSQAWAPSPGRIVCFRRPSRHVRRSRKTAASSEEVERSLGSCGLEGRLFLCLKPPVSPS
ncbi:hypothetical protein BS47DRAFT_921427 [Hydnum rufescens UP504]|uniref:Uncharacterized protein n=1 Tax=Hydnum rufescens UP504 TaxID=1448309 RepID=A0A9P6BAQ8_9AGAM|nr:hypothetical protein BS47DRAFT_921427 [Hydnum rufescens UP504]